MGENSKEARDRYKANDLIRRHRSKLRLITASMHKDTPFRIVPLIDADGEAYRAAYQEQDSISRAKDLLDKRIKRICDSCNKPVGDITDRWYSTAFYGRDEKDLINTLNSSPSWITTAETSPILFLSSSMSFRNYIGSFSYKEGRRDHEDPSMIQMVRVLKDHMRESYNVIEADLLEADDLLLYTHYNWELLQTESDKIDLPIVVSNDKDVLNVHTDLKIDPTSDQDVDHCNRRYRYYSRHGHHLVLDEWTNSLVFPEYQRIVGDNTDNIKGLPGKGEKMFASVLKSNIEQERPSLGMEDNIIDSNEREEDKTPWDIGTDILAAIVEKREIMGIRAWELISGELSQNSDAEDTELNELLHLKRKKCPLDISGNVLSLAQEASGRLYRVHYGHQRYTAEMEATSRLLRMLTTDEDIQRELGQDKVNDIHKRLMKAGMNLEM